MFFNPYFSREKSSLCSNFRLRQDNYNVSYSFRKADDSGYLADNDRAVRIYINGNSVGDSNFLIFVNTWTDKVNFNISAPAAGKKWVRLIDTDNWTESNNNYWSTPETMAPGLYGVFPWSVVVLEEVNQ